MYKVNIYMRVRRACLVEGMSVRKAAKEFGLNRRTVQKMLNQSLPPGYQRKDRPLKPKLGPHLEFINQILKDDKHCPKKQKHTAKRIFVRLKEERGYDGGYTIVREYVAQQRIRGKEMYCPLTASPWECTSRFWRSVGHYWRDKTKGPSLCDGSSAK